MAHGRPWTGAEEKWLKAAISTGLTREEICAGLGREPDTVRRKCYRLGIDLPHRMKEKSDPVYIQTPSSLEKSFTRLREACLDMFVRESNRRGLSMEETMAAILGAEPHARPSGSERPYVPASSFSLAA